MKPKIAGPTSPWRNSLVMHSDGHLTVVTAAFSCAMALASIVDKARAVSDSYGVHPAYNKWTSVQRARDAIDDMDNWSGAMYDPELDGTFQINKGFRQARKIDGFEGVKCHPTLVGFVLNANENLTVAALFKALAIATSCNRHDRIFGDVPKWQRFIMEILQVNRPELVTDTLDLARDFIFIFV